MLSEIPRTAQQMLSPRAEVARLTLQLRSTLQDIETVEAEAEADVRESSSSLEALNDRIGALIDQRRQAFDADMASARSRATERLEAARSEAAAIIAAATPPVPAPTPPPPPPAADPGTASAALAADDTERADPSTADVFVPSPGSANGQVVGEPSAWTWVPDDQKATSPVPPDDLGSPPPPAPPPGSPLALPPAPGPAMTPPLPSPPPPPPTAPPAPPAPRVVFAPPSVGSAVTAVGPTTATDAVRWGPPRPSGPAPVQVVIDAESFGRAFAAALAPILESIERAQSNRPVAPPTQAYRVVPPAPPPKRSFWANAWHADVLLSGIAVIIVLAVLVAWTS